MEFRTFGVIGIIAFAVSACGAEAPIDDVGDITQEAISNINNVGVARRFNRNVVDIYQTANCVWTRTSGNSSWQSLICPSAGAPKSVGGVSLPPDGRRCFFWLDFTQNDPGTVRFKCESTAFAGNWGSAQAFSTAVNSSVVPSGAVKRMVAVGANKTGEIPGVFAIGFANNAMVRWFQNGAWSPSWCHLGRIPDLPDNSLHDFTVRYDQNDRTFSVLAVFATGMREWRPSELIAMRQGNCAISSDRWSAFANGPDRLSYAGASGLFQIVNGVINDRNATQPELFRAVQGTSYNYLSSTPTTYQVYVSSTAGNVYWRQFDSTRQIDLQWHLLP